MPSAVCAGWKEKASPAVTYLVPVVGLSFDTLSSYVMSAYASACLLCLVFFSLLGRPLYPGRKTEQAGGEEGRKAEGRKEGEGEAGEEEGGGGGGRRRETREKMVMVCGRKEGSARRKKI